MANETLSDQISAQIRRLRKEQNLTQEKLAEKAKMDFSYIGRIERNQVSFSVNTIEKIIHALDVTHAEFFEFLKLENNETEIFQLITKINESENRDVMLNMIKQMIQLSLSSKNN